MSTLDDPTPLHDRLLRLEAKVSELQDVVAKFAMRTSRLRREPKNKRLIASSACDKLYRLRSGTTAATYRAGLIPGRWRGYSGRGRPGHALMVSAVIAADLFDAHTYVTGKRVSRFELE